MNALNVNLRNMESFFWHHFFFLNAQKQGPGSVFIRQALAVVVNIDDVLSEIALNRKCNFLLCEYEK